MRMQHFSGLSSVPCCKIQHQVVTETVPEAPAGDNDHSSRSQVRGRLCGGAVKKRNRDAGVRVDREASDLSEAILANKEEQCRGKHGSRAGKRAFKRAVRKEGGTARQHYL